MNWDADWWRLEEGWIFVTFFFLIFVGFTGLFCGNERTRKWFNQGRMVTDYIALSATHLILISWSQLRENTETWSFVMAIITMVLAVGWSIFLSALPIIDAFRGT